MLMASYGPDGQQQWMVEKWKSRPKKVRGIPTFPPSRRRLRLDYFLTPQTTLQFSTPLLTQTLQSRQGDTMWVGSTTAFIPLTTAPEERTVLVYVERHTSPESFAESRFCPRRPFRF